MVHFTKSQTHLCLHFEGENINWKVNKNLLLDGVNENDRHSKQVGMCYTTFKLRYNCFVLLNFLTNAVLVLKENNKPSDRAGFLNP